MKFTTSWRRESYLRSVTKTTSVLPWLRCSSKTWRKKLKIFCLAQIKYRRRCTINDQIRVEPPPQTPQSDSALIKLKRALTLFSAVLIMTATECMCSPSWFHLASRHSRVGQAQDPQRKEDILLRAKKTETASTTPKDRGHPEAVVDPSRTLTSTRPIQRLTMIWWQLRMRWSRSLYTLSRSLLLILLTLRSNIRTTHTTTILMRRCNITTATWTTTWSLLTCRWYLITTLTTKTKLTKSETSSIMETTTTES